VFDTSARVFFISAEYKVMRFYHGTYRKITDGLRLVRAKRRYIWVSNYFLHAWMFGCCRSIKWGGTPIVYEVLADKSQFEREERFSYRTTCEIPQSQLRVLDEPPKDESPPRGYEWAYSFMLNEFNSEDPESIRRVYEFYEAMTRGPKDGPNGIKNFGVSVWTG